MFEHDHDCCHGHDHSPKGEPEPMKDPAAQSLAEALRLSFKLLSVIMVLVVVAFLATGFSSIEPDQKGIVMVLGRAVDEKGPGLAYNWPFPIGRIEKVPVKEDKIAVSDFWLFETPDQVGKELLDRPVPDGGLRLQQGEGALLTGDRFYIHVKLEARYVIESPLMLRQNSGDPKALAHAAVASAAIRSAATRTAEGLLVGEEQAPFLGDTQDLANQQLLAMNSGMRITSIQMTEKTVPLAPLRKYVEADEIRSKMNDKINAAKGEAEALLQSAAGPNYRKLVGQAYPSLESASGDQAGQTVDGIVEHDLIGQYGKAREAGQDELAAGLLARIDDILTDSRTSGQASRLLAEARAQSTATVESVKGRVNEFQMLLAEFQRSPEVLMERKWLATREEILDHPLVSKYYLLPSDQKTVLRINPDPEILKQIRAEMQKEKAAGSRP